MRMRCDAPTETKRQLEDILTEVNWTRISRRYFGKSSSWMYNKLNEIDGNGGTGGFTEAERERLRGALRDLAARLCRTADNFK